MEKRALIAIVLSVLILVLYQEWSGRFYPPPMESPNKESGTFQSAPPAREPERRKAMSPLPKPHIREPEIVVRAAKEVRIETDHYIAVMTTRGARLKSWQLKDYRTLVAKDSPPFEMITAKSGVPYPLGVQLGGRSPFTDENLVYETEVGNLNLTGHARGTLTFTGRIPGGGSLSKRFLFTGSAYTVELEVAVRGGRSDWQPTLQLTTGRNSDDQQKDAPFEGLITLVGGKLKREDGKALSEGKKLSGEIPWAGFGFTYFFFGVLPEGIGDRKLEVGKVGPGFLLSLSGADNTVDPQRARYTLFMGPKDLDLLNTLGRGLERSIDFGYFTFVSAPLLHILRFFHKYTGSYGIDIILLTILIKLLLAPLTHKSFVSMKNMSKLQPQMQRIKEKFKDDKEKMNKEIMDLYRRNKVNPLGGCLPMLLQFPVFIGLYNALRTPIELRHASFMWIEDLSRPDYESLPFTVGDYHLGIPILVLLMGASMFVQQWMTPSAGDPNQRRMMMMMPVVFTALFVTFPAGLTVYWLVNNILTIGQQYLINRMTK